MTVHASPSAFSGPRRALLIGCAIGGLCVAASQVDAQAFNANPKTVAGTVGYDRATPGIETITIDSPTAIIHWTPPSVPAIFLPGGNVATFINGPSVNDYVVLNRILTTQPIRFDGTVLGLLGDLAAGTAAPGGTIIFSSPGGIIIGSTAVFDVGNLVLTSLNVADDGAGNFFDPATGFLFNNGAATPNAAIVTEPGAQINALNEGSFVAMLAPRIVHGGSVRVNGSAAYVAGEQIQMRVNQGLFDIIVDTGSDNATPLIHTGSTGGPASTGPGDTHRIYMVAVPKNQAITAILQGNVGFDPAVSAAIENGAIVLSAGFNVIGGEVDRFGALGPPPKPGPGATFEIRGGTMRSDLFGFAITDMLASGQATGSLAFLQDVSLFAGRRAHLFAGAGQNVTVAGNAIVSAARNRSADPALFDFTGGEALIFAQSGSLSIAGNATVDASGTGRVDVATSRAGNGTGGTAGIFADGGSVQIAGATAVLATGTGGTIDFAPDLGGEGTGGTALVEGRNGGTVQIGGSLSADASGIASRENGLGPVPVIGATGTGGNVSISATGGGSVSVGGALEATASGSGGDVEDGPGNSGGTGQGGTISILAGGTVTFAGSSIIAANAFGGLGPNGGEAMGGRIMVDAAAGQIDFLGDAIMNADATGGDGAFIFGGTGGGATGGDILIRARSGAAASRVRGAAILLSAQGIGGVGADGAVGTPAGRGGDARGGTIDLLAEAGNGTVQFGAVTALAGGTGGQGGAAQIDGDGGRGGDGFGGAIRAGTIGGAAGSPLTGTAQFASLDLGASGAGGNGGSGSGAGGNATGGATSLLAAGIPTVIAGNAALRADAAGGTGGVPAGAGTTPGAIGLGDGGTILIASAAFGAAGGTLSAGNVTGTASATGAAGTGNSPGEWHVTASAGATINLANLSLTAAASGAPALLPFSSLEAPGGTINITQVAALSTPGEIRVIADGAGRIAGGTLNLAAGGDVIITHSNRGPGFTIDVGTLDIQGANVIAAPGSASRASGRVTVAALGNVSVGGQLDGREIVITAAAVDLAATGAIGGAATDFTDIRATGNATVAGQIQGRNILLTSAALAVGGTGAIGTAATDLTDIRATGNATVAGQIQGRNILLTSAALAVGGTGAIGTAATDLTDIRATGNATVAGRILGRRITITAAAIDIGGTGAIGGAATDLTDIRTPGNATVAGQMLGRNILLASNAIGLGATGVIGGAGTDRAELRALGNVTVAGRVLGRDIQIGSSDIDITATGAIGDAGTEVATLVLNATGQLATLGGTTQGPGYTLTQAEAGRIRAGTLRVLAPALGTGPSLVVRDLTLNGGGAAAGIGILEVNTPGIARVEGALLMTNALAGNGISFTARERLEVPTATGSIRVRDAAGMPGGTLLLSSNNIWIASQAIIDQLRLNPNYAGRDDDLIDNDGVDAPRGYVEAGGVTLATGGTLFVQNSTGATGAFLTGTDFGGITVGAGGLAIQSAATPATVTAFGRRLNADGSFTTGDDFFFAVNFAAGGAPLAAGYTGQSTFNTCIIVTGICAPRVPANLGPGGEDPITGPVGGSAAIALPGAAEEDDLVDTSFASDPLIDEPVTSGGESSLWECDKDDDGDCDDQDN